MLIAFTLAHSIAVDMERQPSSANSSAASSHDQRSTNTLLHIRGREWRDIALSVIQQAFSKLVPKLWPPRHRRQLRLTFFSLVVGRCRATTWTEGLVWKLLSYRLRVALRECPLGRGVRRHPTFVRLAYRVCRRIPAPWTISIGSANVALFTDGPI